MSDLDALVEAEEEPTAAARPRGRARARHLWRQARPGIVSRWDVLAVIAAGGAAGSLARWGLSQILAGSAGAFPWGTFAANITGCFLIGALMVFVADVWPPSRLVRPFLGVGILGGYTTFSSYMLDTRTLLVAGKTGVAAAYLFATLAGGLAAVWLGVTTVRGALRVARWGARHRRPDPGGRSGGTPGGAAARQTDSPPTRRSPR